MTYNEITDLLVRDTSTAVAALYPGIPVPAVEIVPPTDAVKADFVSNIAFHLAKMVKAQPRAVAGAIVDHLQNQDVQKSVYTVEAAGPGFINFRLSDAILIRVLENVVAEGGDFGRNNSLEGQTWVIEHTSPNPNKAMHIGHLRNNLVGMSVAELLAFSGAKVIRDAIDNNRGIAIAKAMWGYLRFKKRDGQQTKSITYWASHKDEWLTPSEVGIKSDHFVGECYALAADATKSDPVADKEIRDIALRWEQHDADIWSLWGLIIDYAHEGINTTLQRVGSQWDTVWHEHEHYEQGRDLVLTGLEKGVFVRLDDGAVLTSLEAYNLPDTIVLKSDGTSLYITQDLALTRLKKEKYKADKLIWVIGPEQSVAMKQVFAVCEQLGIGSYDSFVHLPYGLVSLVDESGARKKMSSRGGNTLLIDDLIDEVRTSLLKTDRGYSDKDAERIAVSAVKYVMLKPARTTDTVIDLKKAISLEGDSGLYILYALARMNTLVEKAPKKADAGASNLNDDERALAIKLTYFPQKVRDATQSYSPNTLVEYVLDLAHDFNALYAKERFITDDPTATYRKMAITYAARQVLTNALGLLRIETVTKI